MEEVSTPSTPRVPASPLGATLPLLRILIDREHLALSLLILEFLPSDKQKLSKRSLKPGKGACAGEGERLVIGGGHLATRVPACTWGGPSAVGVTAMPPCLRAGLPAPSHQVRRVKAF